MGNIAQETTNMYISEYIYSLCWPKTKCDVPFWTMRVNTNIFRQCVCLRVYALGAKWQFCPSEWKFTIISEIFVLIKHKKHTHTYVRHRSAEGKLKCTLQNDLSYSAIEI